MNEISGASVFDYALSILPPGMDEPHLRHMTIKEKSSSLSLLSKHTMVVCHLIILRESE